MSRRFRNFNSSRANAGWSKFNRILKMKASDTKLKGLRRLIRLPKSLIVSKVFRLRSITILSMIVLTLLSAMLGLCLAANAETTPPAEKAKVEFTKIQDLNLKAKAINRPVRQKWAVVIGISKYQDRRLNSEDGYAAAARDFAACLESPKAGRFRADHVRLLTDEKANQTNINNSFSSSWLGKLAAEDDLVVVYIAARSFPTTDGNAYICSYSAALDNIFGSCLTIQSLMQTIRRNVKSDRIVLIMESAYSGGASLGSAGKSATPRFTLDLEKVAIGKGFVILSSSRADQLSWKTIFTDNLIASLKEKDGFISLDEVFNKTRQKTEFDSVNRIYAGRKQTPQLKSDWQGNDLVLGCEAVEATAGIPESMQSFIGAEAHYFKANQAVLNSDMNTAMAEYQAAISEDPGLADARADYAVALGLKGDWKGAEEELRKAIAIRPDDALYFTNYARVLGKLGQKEECKRMLEKAYSLNPKDRVILMALADRCVESGDRAKAMTLMDQALLLYPDNASVQDRMAFLLSVDGRIDEAFQHAKEAVRLAPDLTAARLKLGALFVLRGDTDSAIKEYQVVLDTNDKNADAHYLLAEALDKKKDPKASDEYKKFLQFAPEQDSRRNHAQERIKASGTVQ